MLPYLFKPGPSSSDRLQKFVAAVEPFAIPNEEGRQRRIQAFETSDTSGNGLLSLIEVEMFVSDILRKAYGVNDGRRVFLAFVKSTRRAFSAAKTIDPTRSSAVLEGRRKTTRDDFVSFSEFRILCAYLCAYAGMQDAFTVIDAGAPTPSHGGGMESMGEGDRRVNLDEWMAHYSLVADHGFYALSGIDNDDKAQKVFQEIDADNSGILVMSEWYDFIERKEVESSTEVGKLLALQHADDTYQAKFSSEEVGVKNSNADIASTENSTVDDKCNVSQDVASDNSSSTVGKELLDTPKKPVTLPVENTTKTGILEESRDYSEEKKFFPDSPAPEEPRTAVDPPKMDDSEQCSDEQLNASKDASRELDSDKTISTSNEADTSLQSQTNAQDAPAAQETDSLLRSENNDQSEATARETDVLNQSQNNVQEKATTEETVSLLYSQNNGHDAPVPEETDSLLQSQNTVQEKASTTGTDSLPSKNNLQATPTIEETDALLQSQANVENAKTKPTVIDSLRASKPVSQDELTTARPTESRESPCNVDHMQQKQPPQQLQQHEPMSMDDNEVTWHIPRLHEGPGAVCDEPLPHYLTFLPLAAVVLSVVCAAFWEEE